MFSAQRNRLTHHIQEHICVISLKRTPERLKDFFRRNTHCLENWQVHVLYGVDGNQHEDIFRRSSLISTSVLKSWSLGAIGSALSHMMSWRMCTEIGQPVVVAEDDAILSSKLRHNFQIHLQDKSNEPPFLLLGWNLDSLLQAELEPGLGLISLFEPSYPTEIELTELVNSTTERQMCKLKRCFGLPAYRITPETAKHLLENLNPLVSQPIPMERNTYSFQRNSRRAA